jgi:hypothetical protein
MQQVNICLQHLHSSTSRLRCAIHVRAKGAASHKGNQVRKRTMTDNTANDLNTRREEGLAVPLHVNGLRFNGLGHYRGGDYSSSHCVCPRPPVTHEAPGGK